MNQPTSNEIKQRISKLAQSRSYSEAAKLAKSLTDANPADIDSWWVLAQLLARLGDYEQAIYCCLQTCQRPSPVYIQALEMAVDITRGEGLWEQGLAPAQALVRAMPESGEAHFKLGSVLFFLMRYLEAAQAFEEAIKFDPQHVGALNRCGMCMGYIGRNDRAIEYYQKSLAVRPSNNRATRLMASSQNYIDSADESLVSRKHFEAAEQIRSELAEYVIATPLAKVSEASTRRLRIGFCSEDFRRHSVAYFLLPILKNYSKDNWEVFCYSDVPVPDSVTREFEGLCDVWRQVRGVDDIEVLEQIREDRIDVLFDLMGYFGQARFGVFARRAAPVQVSYLGYPHTSGFAELDYRLVDAQTDPEGDQACDEHYSEMLHRLPGSFLCFEPASQAPPVSPLPAQSHGGVTFGSFNSMQKFTPRTIEVWSQILLALPAARLIIKSVPLGEEKLAEATRQTFNAYGVSPDRIEILGLLPDPKEHLELYGRVDIHLDTFPYNGTTTTCEALWQGVPSVTLAGLTHRSRVGLSLMHQVGLDDWVAQSEQAYIDLAIAKASDLNALAPLRSKLRPRMQSSSLMNAPLMVEHLDTFFRRALDGAVEGAMDGALDSAVPPEETAS